MKVKPRRWLEGSDGLLESDRDFVLNNVEACVEFLTREAKATRHKPALGHKVCFEVPAPGIGGITLTQSTLGRRRFNLRYGQSLKRSLPYSEACTELGECILHMLCRDGRASDEGEY